MLSLSGLYYKLHGCYRPTTMKKSIIKRRKRVVPAMRDHSPGAGTQSSAESSASPEAHPARLAHGLDRPLLAPPPVDFTGYNMNAAATIPHRVPVYQKYNLHSSADHTPLAQHPTETATLSHRWNPPINFRQLCLKRTLPLQPGLALSLRY